MNLKYQKLYLILFLIIVLFFSVILLWGPITIPISKIWAIISGDQEVSLLLQNIFWKLRFAKALTALLAGAALSVSGLIMQTYFQNPLAGPFVLGIHGGSSLGVALWIMASTAISLIIPPYLFNLGTVFFAFGGGVFILGLLIFLSARISGKIILLVVGLMLGHVSSGIINILVAISDAKQIKSFLLWSLGSFQRVAGVQLIIFSSIILLGLMISLLLIKNLNVLLLGNRYAKSLGLSLKRIKLILILLTALLSGTVTAFCGPVAFIGTIGPHIARWYFKSSDHRVLIPASIMIGGILALFSEFLASSGEVIMLPLNAITGLMGAPIIFMFLWKRRQEEIL